jgi:alpha-beta hydrolase superfamily lysophospholipase
MNSTNKPGRRGFLRSLSASALFSIGRPRMGPAAQQTAKEVSGEEPRWFASFRASDYYLRGADVGEVLAVSRRIPEGNFQAYISEWGALADRTEMAAAAFEREGRTITAANHWLRASHYASRVYGVYLRYGDGAHARPAYRRVRNLFNKGVDLAGPNLQIERITIPYKGKTLKGWFAPAGRDGRRRPAVYHTGGADTTKETNFFRSFVWEPYLERDVSCVLVDAPGQGEALNLDDLHLEAHFEDVSAAVSAYLASRPDVDPARIGLYGSSMGGYFGGRAAAFDSRLAAVALQTCWYDMLRDSYDFCPQFKAQNRYLIGASSDQEARRILADFNLRGVANRIKLPIFGVHGDRDEVVRVDGAKELFAEISSSERRLKIAAGARHNMDAEIPGLQDWLTIRIGGPAAATGSGKSPKPES